MLAKCGYAFRLWAAPDYLFVSYLTCLHTSAIIMSKFTQYYL